MARFVFTPLGCASYLSRSRTSLFLAFLVTIALANPAPGQSQNSQPASGGSKVASHVPIPSAHEQFAPYWTTEAGWRSELQLRNNLAAGNLTVTPFLRAVDGTEFPLPPVTIAPNEVKSVDVSDAVNKTAPQLMGTYGSVVFRYTSVAMRNLYAAVMVFDSGHPIAFHFDAFVEATDFDAGSREGIWWLPNATATDQLILTNDNEKPLPVTLRLYDATGKTWNQPLSLQPKTVSLYSVRELLSKAGLSGTYGGFKIDVASRVGSLDTAYLLFDETVGFSALMKTFDRNPQATIEQRARKGAKLWTTRAPMLALSQPDPALGLPPGTVLQPQIFVRNTTGLPVSATARFNWRAGANTGSSLGPVLQLAPYQTRRIDVAALQRNNIIPANANWASVEIATPSRPDTLMAVAASYDETLKYGAQTPFNDQLTFHWEGGEWMVDALHNSFITTGNGGSVPVKAQMTLYYDAGKKRYDIEENLNPHEQIWVDVGKLIRQAVPDKNGQILPADVMTGSYELRDLTDRGIGNLFEGQIIIDKTFGHVAYGCAQCCGYGPPSMFYDPLDLSISFQDGQDIFAEDYCAGGRVSVLGYFSGWGTGNQSVATAAGHMITGVGAGSTTNFASGTLLWSDSGQKHCSNENFNPNGPVNVGPYQVEPLSNGAQGTFPAGQCPTGGPYPGYLRQVNNQVQYYGGAGYPYSVTAGDTLSCGSRRDLGCASPATGSELTLMALSSMSTLSARPFVLGALVRPTPFRVGQ